MSTEQSESTNSEGDTPQVDITQQATTPTPTTAQHRAKNPKRVAASKLVAERTRLAREQQKKAAAEAAIIIANNKTKATAPVSEPDPPIAYESPKSTEEKNSSLSTTQWLAVASIVVSLIGIYYKHEELKAVFSKKTPESQPARKKTPEPQPARATQTRGVKHLD